MLGSRFCSGARKGSLADLFGAKAVAGSGVLVSVFLEASFDERPMEPLIVGRFQVR